MQVATSSLAPDDSRGAASTLSDPVLSAAADPSTFVQLTANLRPAVRRLAESVTATEPNAMILSFFRQQPGIALTSADLAAMIELPLPAVAAALAEWRAAGLIECLPAGGLVFYRMTRDPEQLQALAELVAWREYWVAALWQVAHSVDPRLYAPQAWNGHMVSGKPAL